MARREQEVRIFVTGALVHVMTSTGSLTPIPDPQFFGEDGIEVHAVRLDRIATVK